MQAHSQTGRLFLLGLRAHWLAQGLLLLDVLLQAVAVLGLVLEVGRAAASGAMDESWQAWLIRLASRISDWLAILVFVAVGLDLLGSALCLCLKRPIVTRALVAGSLMCKLAIPASVVAAASWNPLAATLAPILTIWLAWILFCLALQRLAVDMRRDELAEESVSVMILGTSILGGMSAVVSGVLYMMVRYEGAILLAALAFAVYVILTFVFCTRYMNFLDGIARIAARVFH